MKIKEIKNREIQKMALLNAIEDFNYLPLEELEELSLISAFRFTKAKYPKNLELEEEEMFEFWKRVLNKEETKALNMLKL